MGWIPTESRFAVEAARTSLYDGRPSEVGQTPSSAADAPVGLLFALLRRSLRQSHRETGPGGPAQTRASAPLASHLAES